MDNNNATVICITITENKVTYVNRGKWIIIFLSVLIIRTNKRVSGYLYNFCRDITFKEITELTASTF